MGHNTYFLPMQMRYEVWCQMAVFTANVSQQLLSWIVQCEFVTPKFASHSPEVWIRLNFFFCFYPLPSLTFSISNPADHDGHQVWCSKSLRRGCPWIKVTPFDFTFLQDQKLNWLPRPRWAGMVWSTLMLPRTTMLLQKVGIVEMYQKRLYIK